MALRWVPAAIFISLCGGVLSQVGFSQSTGYQAERLQRDGVEVVRLVDAAAHVEVSIVPSLGNNAFEMKVNGHNVLWRPVPSLQDWKAKPSNGGNPLLSPWANRLDHEGYWANGKEYRLNASLANYRLDQFGQPIHGLVTYTHDWEVVEVTAAASGAFVRSRLEFFRQPEWMAQFPFAHTIEMIYRLQGGILEVQTAVENHSTQTMPLSLGFHPYFQLDDAPRDEWSITLPARQHVELGATLVPSGVNNPVEPMANRKLAGLALDDVYTELVRGENNRAAFSVEGKKQKVTVLYGPKYPVAVVYAPPGRDFICFEPMTGPTNAFNLAQSGNYASLQSVPPRGTWRESFWIQPSGF